MQTMRLKKRAKAGLSMMKKVTISILVLITRCCLVLLKGKNFSALEIVGSFVYRSNRLYDLLHDGRSLQVLIMKKSNLYILCLSAFPVIADISITINGMSNYLFNGESQPEEDPAIQAFFDWSGGIGWY